jgi:N-acetylneuraminic acid mutarotase
MTNLLMLLLAASTLPTSWRQLPALPDREGFAGAFAGVSGGALIVAGGANFPDKKPWEGGKKVWYDQIFVLDRPDGEWKAAGTLGKRLAYGVSLSYRDSVICVGGSDADRHHADAFHLQWTNGQIDSTPLPPLPRPIANAWGAIIADHLYIAGGQASPDARAALDTLYTLDLSAADAKWRACDPCPGGGRILAVAAAMDGDFYVVGGAALIADDAGKVTRRYRNDAWRFRPGSGWMRLPDLPHPVVAAPSPAPDERRAFFILGGDDGTQVGVTPPLGHTGFSRKILRFDVAANRWEIAGKLPAPRVTTPCIRWNDLWVIPSGEAFPGVRSPQVWGIGAIAP